MTIKVTYNVTDVYMSQSVSPVYITVSYSDGGASGGGVWGSITGTLSNQTDLQTALDLKVPYSGATGNVNLGEYELKAGQLTLDTSPTGTAAVGTIRWNDTTGTSETTLKGGNVIIKNGVDLVARVVNKVTPNTTLTKAAYQAVRVSGAQGQRLAIELAQANNDAGSADTIGLVTETIAPNQEGFIMTVGQLEGINTTGSLQGETWADGDVLYLSPTTAGAITNVKPTGATGHLVIIGYVEYAHANNGKIYVKVINGFELAELHDTSIVTPTNNQGLFYNSSNSLWENKSIATALGYTPEQPLTFNSPLSRAGNVVSIPQATGSVNGFLSATDWTTFNSKQAALGYTPANAATTLTINGVTFDLSANRSWTISTGISGSGASGQVTYWTGASAVSGSNNLFWDNANGRLGIGTNAPTSALHVTSTTWNSTQPFISLINLDPQGAESKGLFVQAGALSASSYIANFANYSGTSFFYLDGTGNLGINNTSPSYRLDVNGVARFQNQVRFANNLWMVSDEGSNRLQFATSSSSIYGSPVGHIWRTASDVTIMTLFSNGNLALGQTSDSGQRLQVIGDTLLRGSGATSATTALTVQNSSSTNLFTVRNDGVVKIGDNIYNDNNSYLNVGKVGGGAARIAIANNSNYQDALFVATSVTSGNINNWSFGQRRDTFFGNTIGSFQIVGGYIDNSGVGSAVGGGYRVPLICNPNGDVLINGGNANVVNGLIGLKVNAPTAHVDITASTTGNASLRIRSGTAPTSPNDGDIWFDGTDIKMRIGGVTKTFTLV